MSYPDKPEEPAVEKYFRTISAKKKTSL